MHKNILLFDGVCNFCNRMVQFIIERDPNAKFEFAALQSSAGQYILKELGLKSGEPDSFVFIHEGKSYIRSSATLHVLKELGGIWKTFYVFIIVPPFIRDFIYDRIAKIRYRIFGRRAECMIPTPDIRERFLSDPASLGSGQTVTGSHR
jgi:predicted DCC family thiol-disulfide oxidoreductase YuxK